MSLRETFLREAGSLLEEAIRARDADKRDYLSSVLDLLTKDPSIGSSLAPMVLRFVDDPHMPGVMREFVAQFIQRAVERTRDLPAAPVLAKLLRDSNYRVVRTALQCVVCIFPGLLSAFVERSRREELSSLVRLWNELNQLKDMALGCLRHTAIGVRLRAVKFVGVLAVALSEKKAKHRDGSGSEFDLSQVPSRHPILTVDKLKQEGIDCIARLAKYTGETDSSAAFSAAVNVLASLSLQHKGYTKKAITALAGEGVSPMRLSSPQSQRTATQALIMVLRVILRNPIGTRFAPTIVPKLAELGGSVPREFESYLPSRPSKRGRGGGSDGGGGKRSREGDLDMYAREREMMDTSDPRYDPYYDGSREGVARREDLRRRQWQEQSSRGGGGSRGPLPMPQVSPQIQSVVNLVMENMHNLPRHLPGPGDMPVPDMDVPNVLRLLELLQVEHGRRMEAEGPPIRHPPPAAPMGGGASASMEEGKGGLLPPGSLPLPISAAPADPRMGLKDSSAELGPVASVSNVELRLREPKLTPADAMRLQSVILRRILRAEKAIAASGGAATRRRLLARMLCLREAKDVVVGEALAHIGEDWGQRYPTAHIWLFRELASGQDERYERFLGQMLESLRAKPEPAFAAIVSGLPRITTAVLEEVRRYCSEQERCVLGLTTLRDLIFRRPTCRAECLGVALSFAVAGEEWVRTPAIRLAVNMLFDPFHEEVLSFARTELEKAPDIAAGGENALALAVAAEAAVELQALLDEVEKREAAVLERAQARGQQRQARKDKAEREATERLERMLEEGDEGARDPAAEAFAAAERDARMRSERDLEEAEEAEEQDDAARLSGLKEEKEALSARLQQKREDHEQTKGRLEGELRAQLLLFFGLCTREPALLLGLAEVFARGGEALQRTMLLESEVLMRGLPSTSPPFLEVVRHMPEGAEPLLLRMLRALSDTGATGAGGEGALPTALVEAVLEAHARTRDARLLLPVLSALGKEQLAGWLPALAAMEPSEVKEAVGRLLQRSALSPGELLFSIHLIDAEAAGLSTRQLVTMLKFSLEQRGVVTKEVMAIALQQLVEESPIPPLLMWTVMNAMRLFPDLIPFIVTLMGKLVAKHIWTDEQLWRGLVKACSISQPHSFALLLQLPPTQLADVFSRDPRLRDSLVAHIREARLAPPKNLVQVLGL